MPASDVIPFRKPSFPNVTIPGLAQGTGVKYCIYRVYRHFEGHYGPKENARHPPRYTCRLRDTSQQTRRFASSFGGRVPPSDTPGCEEALEVFPRSPLVATGTTIIRADGFSHFIGKFTFDKIEMGKVTGHYYRGTIELFGRIGSHVKLGEACDERLHHEGWLVGRGVRNLSQYTLRALIVAYGRQSEGDKISFIADPLNNVVTGAVIKVL
jgi:hypothetical protein